MSVETNFSIQPAQSGSLILRIEGRGLMGKDDALLLGLHTYYIVTVVIRLI